jgi:hypothetical protein
MSNLLVKISKGPDDKQVVELGISIQMTGTFRNGIVEKIGHRKMSRKFIEGVCKGLVKQIQPQLLEAIKKEHEFFLHPETIPKPPEGDPPPLNHALLAREEMSAEEATADPGYADIEEAPTKEQADATE